MLSSQISCRSILTLSLPILVFLTSCVNTKVIVTNSGGKKYSTKLDDFRAVGLSKTTKGCKIAVLPFMNTAQIVSTLNVNVALANQQMERAISSLNVPSHCSVVPPSAAQKAISEAQLTSAYAKMLGDYETTGLLDVVTIKKMGESMDVDTIVHGSLTGYEVDSASNTFRSATVKFMAFDAHSGELDWTVQVTGRPQFVDTRQTTKQVVARDDSVAMAYTMGAGLSGLLGLGALIAGASLEQDWMAVGGGMLLAPAIVIPFVWGKDEEIRTIGKFDQPQPPRTIDESLGDLVQKVIDKIFEEHINIER